MLAIVRKSATALSMMTAVFTLAGPASADTTTVKVGHADLNLTTSSGVAALDRRVSRAVTSVCGDRSADQIANRSAIRKCRANAFRNAREQRTQVIAEATRRGQSVVLAAR